VLIVVLLAAGFLLGALVGRWWALLAAAALGVFIGFINETELESWFMGLLYGVPSAAGIAVGVVVRWLARRRAV